MRRLSVVAFVLVGFAVALPASAGAHARLVRTVPADGTVVAQPPAAARVVFDDAVRPRSGIAAVRNGGGSVLGGRPRVVAGGRVLEVPLESPLPDGDYTVRWDVVSDDGHELSGVVAFGVGLGRAAPVPVLTAGTGVESRDLISRWLFFAGLLTAAGSVAFRLLVWRGALAAVAPAPPVRARIEREELRTGSAVLCAGFLLAFIGGAAADDVGSGTRFGLANDIATVEAALGATLAALAYAAAMPLLWIPTALLAVALVPMPTLAGHALDRDQSALAPLADVVHVGSAAVWLGALLSLALVVPRCARALGPSERDRLYGRIARRASGVVIVSVAMLSATGVLRAVDELSGIEELRTTGYGRTIVVKTALLAVLLAVGWQTRSRLVPGRFYGRLHRNVLAELGGFVLLISAVALLTDLPPGGRASPRPTAAPPPAAAPLPPVGALQLAGQARDLAVGIAAKRTGAGRVAVTATVLGQDGSGVRGLDVALGIDGPADAVARACGPGCYAATLPDSGGPRRIAVRLQEGGRRPATVDFRLAQRWPAPAAGSIVSRATRVFRSLRSVSTLEVLESKPGNRIVSHFREAAPARLSYRIEGGAEAVVIGSRRWDRASATGAWSVSPQQPVSVPAPPWSRVRDARLLGASVLRGQRVLVVSFLDPVVPAWFTIRVEPKTGRTVDVRMTAAAHFMRLRYSGFDAPLRIRPPR